MNQDKNQQEFRRAIFTDVFGLPDTSQSQAILAKTLAAKMLLLPRHKLIESQGETMSASELERYVSQLRHSKPEYRTGYKWYTRNEIVGALKRMNYSEGIAQELADWFLLHIRSSFDRGFYVGVKTESEKHLEHRKKS